MGISPDELEAVDTTDPTMAKEALVRAAERIRELEQEGIRAVGGTVAAMLDQAAHGVDEILAKARSDAATIKEAADADRAEAAAEREKAAAEAEAAADALMADAAENAGRQIGDAERSAAALIDEARAKADGIADAAEADAAARSARVLTDAQARLDRLLAAERGVHDRLTSALADIQTSVSRVGVDQAAEFALTVEDPSQPVIDQARWADDSVEPAQPRSA